MTTVYGTSLLRDILGLGPTGNTAAHDAVLVCIDFENIDGLDTAKLRDASGQMGVAILDTRELYASPGDSIISTHNFAVGPPNYSLAAQNKFIFGNTFAVGQEDLANSLLGLIPTSRNVILVAHGAGNELRALRLLDVNVDVFNGHLDTLKLSHAILPDVPRRTLGHLLEYFGIPHQHLHCAGNDAHFTLQSLLVLAVKSFQQQKRTSVALEQKIGVLKQVSRFCSAKPKKTRRMGRQARRKAQTLIQRLKDFTSKIGKPNTIKERSKGKKKDRTETSTKLGHDYGGSFVTKYDSATQIQLRDERAARRAAEKDASY